MTSEAAKIRTWLDANPKDRKGTRGTVRKSNLTDNESAKITTDKGVIQGYCGVAAVAGLGIGIWLARSISGSASHAAAAAISLSKGDLNVSVNASSSDEMGDLGRAFHEMTVYLKEMVGAAAEVASGNLAAEVHPRGSSDALGNALQSMVTNLNELVGTVKTNATSILSASQQLEESSGQMASATGQIASAINEVTTSTVSLNSLAQDSTIEVSRLASGSEPMKVCSRLDLFQTGTTWTPCLASN